MAERHMVACPVCNSTQQTVKFEPRVHLDNPKQLYGAASGVPGAQQIVTCDECGMIFESPRFDEEDIVTAYAEAEEASHDTQYPMRVDSFHRAMKRVRRYLPAPPGQVLDIGCAGGAFLEAAQRFGYEAIGLEPCRYLVREGNARGLSIHEGTIGRHPFEPKSFDMVCLWDVIEHLACPRATLTAVRSLLKEGGLLLICFPDIGTWQAKIAGRRFWWLLSVHLHYFTRRTMAEMCHRSGFRVFRHKRYWQTLQLGYLQEIAIKLHVPLGGLCRKLTPGFLRRLRIPYYASQTLTLAEVAS